MNILSRTYEAKDQKSSGYNLCAQASFITIVIACVGACWRGYIVAGCFKVVLPGYEGEVLLYLTSK